MTFPIRSLVLATVTGALAMPAAAQTAWDMPTPYGDTVFHTQNIMEFADDVREATGGAVDITVHSAGSLFGHPEIKDAVRRGLAPIGEILLSRLSNENPVFEVDSIPFLAASYDDARALWDASRPETEELLAEQGLTLLYAVPWPGQSLYLTEEVTDPAALQGVSFRAYNAATERLAELLGMVPTQVEAGDIPTAFATGRVDAMMTSPSTGVSTGLGLRQRLRRRAGLAAEERGLREQGRVRGAAAGAAGRGAWKPPRPPRRAAGRCPRPRRRHRSTCWPRTA